MNSQKMDDEHENNKKNDSEMWVHIFPLERHVFKIVELFVIIGGFWFIVVIFRSSSHVDEKSLKERRRSHLVIHLVVFSFICGYSIIQSGAWPYLQEVSEQLPTISHVSWDYFNEVFKATKFWWATHLDVGRDHLIEVSTTSLHYKKPKWRTNELE